MKRQLYEEIHPSKPYVLMTALRAINSIVHDVVRLEGINMSLPEVTTIMDGITVGGYKISDQAIVVNQGNAWRKLLRDVECGEFDISAQYACELHAVLAENEVLNAGQFRYRQVQIVGTEYTPPSAIELEACWQEAEQAFDNAPTPFEQAVGLFADMARCQFFFGGNKRIGRMMMAGHLLSLGLPMMTVSHTEKMLFEQTMLAYYKTGDKRWLYVFFEQFCLDAAAMQQMKDQNFVSSIHRPLRGSAVILKKFAK